MCKNASNNKLCIYLHVPPLPTMCGYLPYAKSSFLEASLIMLAQFLY